MVMGWRFHALVVDVSQHHEAQIRVLVKCVYAPFRIRAAVRGDEILVYQKIFQILADDLTATVALIRRYRGPAIVAELIKCIAHGFLHLVVIEGGVFCRRLNRVVLQICFNPSNGMTG